MTGRIIAVTGDKGGVGKTTLAVLIAEWLLHKGETVTVVDADPSESAKTWLEKCADEGRQINSRNAPTTIVDTAGTVGASLNKYIRQASVIVVPFQPHEVDLEVVLGWFLSVKPEIQERVVFVPNRLQNTKEQKEGIRQVEETILDEKCGFIAEGLTNRPAIYAKVVTARSHNFFDSKLDEKAKSEIVKTMTHILMAR